MVSGTIIAPSDINFAWPKLIFRLSEDALWDVCAVKWLIVSNESLRCSQTFIIKYAVSFTLVTKEQKAPPARTIQVMTVDSPIAVSIDECLPAEYPPAQADQQYHVIDSPRKLRKQLDKSNQCINELNKSLKPSQQKSCRLKISEVFLNHCEALSGKVADFQWL